MVARGNFDVACFLGFEVVVLFRGPMVVLPDGFEPAFRLSAIAWDALEKVIQ